MRRIAIAAALLWAGVIGAAEAAGGDGWPRAFTTAKGTRIVIYEPQPETLRGDTITARAAISATRAGTSSPQFGVVFLSARIAVDRTARTVTMHDVSARRVRFPNITPEQESRLAAILESEMPKWRLVGSYDRLLANLAAAERERRSAAGLKNEPPKILFASKPSVLLLFDGEPRVREVGNGPWMAVVNTPFFVARDERDGTYYLAGGSRWWYRAQDWRGPWTPISEPPSGLAELAARSGATSPDGTDAGAPPEIVVAAEPTELVVSEGSPAFAPVDALGILRMDNTESDVLMDLISQRYFLLVGGRWYSAPSLSPDGWQFVPADALPPELSRIPPDSPAGGVLASVPGTPEAQDAALDALIPETAAIRRTDATVDVRYDGPPDFVEIAGTRVRYGANASTAVLAIDGRYFACDRGIWFVADDPSGPWILADSIPEEDIAAIPPSAPVYPVRYVSIYGSTPEYVYVGYTPGYLGCLVGDWGTVVWGTGWYYPPWIGPGGCWEWAWTWGWGARYAEGGWGFGISWSYPFFESGLWWGGYGGGGARGGYPRRWWGAGGYRRPVSAVPVPRASPPGVSRPSGPGRAPLGPRSGAPPVRPIPPPRAPRPAVGFHPRLAAVPHDRGRSLYEGIPAPARSAATREAPGPAMGVANDVFASPDGKAFRRTGDGHWQERSQHQWRTLAPSAPSSDSNAAGARPPVPQLERDFSARQRGGSGTGAMAPPAPVTRPPAAVRASPRPAPPPRPPHS
jgi:hypothetical protein